jgi:regulator of RNase E activity RraA
MSDYVAFAGLATTTLADIVGPARILDAGIRPLWAGVARIAGPACTVYCPPGDNLMLHLAIYRAPPGSIIVVQSGERSLALAGGNVCAVAQKNGVAGLVLDGLVRDIGEIRANAFAVFGRGIVPIAAAKQALGTLEAPIECGGVRIESGDILVADEDGVVAVPAADAARVLDAATACAAREASQSLEEWRADHRRRITEALRRLGYKA